MELMDKSLHQLYKLVYDTLKLNIPENVVGKMAEAVRNVRCIHMQSCFGHCILNFAPLNQI